MYVSIAVHFFLNKPEAQNAVLISTNATLSSCQSEWRSMNVCDGHLISHKLMMNRHKYSDFDHSITPKAHQCSSRLLLVSTDQFNLTID